MKFFSNDKTEIFFQNYISARELKKQVNMQLNQKFDVVKNVQKNVQKKIDIFEKFIDIKHFDGIYTSEWCGLGWVLASKIQPANGVGWSGWVGFWIRLNWVFFRIEMNFNHQKNDHLNALKIDFKTFYF